ncbi:MAG: lysophospholipid acyltransferase family protein [Pseudomonadota bacterium]
MAGLRGALFTVCFYGLMAVMGVLGVVLLWSEAHTRAWMKLHNRIAFVMLRGLCGIRLEIRGTVPTGRVVVAAKHQSLLDVLMLYNALPEARFVMKRELTRAPVFGFYAMRTGAVPVDRSGRGGAMRGLVEAFSAAPGQVVVYPQGTRVAPGASAPYRKGAAVIAEALDAPIVLVATNAGKVWPRRGVAKHPGTAVVSFLETLPVPSEIEATMAEVEARTEAASDAL